MFCDRTFNLSFLVSFILHLFIIPIFSLFVLRPPEIERIPPLFEVEILPFKSPIVTRIPKEAVKVRVKPVNVKKQIKSIPKRPRKEILSIFRPRLSQEPKITTVLEGFSRTNKARQGHSNQPSISEGIRYGLLPIENPQRHPLFERVETGEVWGQGRMSSGERLAKLEPSSRIGVERVSRPSIRRLEKGDPGGISLGGLSGEVDKVPYYHLEGPAMVGRALIYQELIPVPRRVEEEGKSLRGKFRFWVLPSGEVDRVVVEETFGDCELDDLAKRTIRRWRFTKGEDEAWGLVSIRIQLVKSKK